MVKNNQINANDGYGLLEGKWEGSFEDGVCPWAWTGSSRIFETCKFGKKNNQIYYSVSLKYIIL